MKLVAIVGTNAGFSYNRLLLEFMKAHFADAADIDVCEIKDIPMFNENVPDDDPPAAKALGRAIAEADGVIVGCPEHNHSVPSALKSVLEWLSYRVHPLNGKPVMIVGASYHPQGSSRAQIHLRQILDSPGVGARVLPGSEFLLGNVKTAFDDQGRLTDQATIDFLEQCFADFVDFARSSQSASTSMVKGDSEMVLSDSVHWDATYDVIVLGFGGAGATAARFAADSGAKVLLVDSAPEGHEGGNTRVCGQLVCSADDEDAMRKYYLAQTAPMELDPEIVDTYVEGMANMKRYFRDYLGVESVSAKKTFGAHLGGMAPEYPEFPGSETVDMILVHEGILDGALWKILHGNVVDRSEAIDVWYRSPARHLIKAGDGRTIAGVQIEREHVLRSIRALNGVVLATGGFENNKRKVQDYLGVPRVAPVGGMYNKGDGIDLAVEAGADLWHMANYESLGLQHGLTFAVGGGERGALPLFDLEGFSQGSIMTVGDDGSRYFKEDEPNRHGHIYHHGVWRVPAAQVHPHLVFDQAKYDELGAGDLAGTLSNAVKADSLEALAKLIDADPQIVVKTVDRFNFFAAQGTDYEYGREPATLRAFGSGPYYAIALQHAMLNTQGGPRRNSRAEIVDPAGQPIPHLYGAGELGGVCAGQYQGGQNIAECLIFGKIAGENAATRKPQPALAMQAGQSGDASATGSRAGRTFASDLSSDAEIVLGPNQYLGRSQAGIGSEMAVRVTTDDAGAITDIEIVKQSETTEVAGDALKKLPQQMIARNTFDVDAISGASVSSKALIQAVKDALSQVPGRQ